MFELHQKKELVYRLAATMSELSSLSGVQLKSFDAFAKMFDYGTVSLDTTGDRNDSEFRKSLLDTIISGLLSISARVDGIENPSAILKKLAWRAIFWKTWSKVTENIEKRSPQSAGPSEPKR